MAACRACSAATVCADRVSTCSCRSEIRTQAVTAPERTNKTTTKTTSVEVRAQKGRTPYSPSRPSISSNSPESSTSSRPTRSSSEDSGKAEGEEPDLPDPAPPPTPSPRTRTPPDPGTSTPPDSPAPTGLADPSLSPDLSDSAPFTRQSLGDEPSPEPVRHGLSTIPNAQLPEQPASVRLDRVLRQVELAPDLPVALAHRHPAKHLQFAVGELDTGVGRLAGRRHRGRGQRVRERGHQLRAGRVPPEVATSTARDGRRDAARVVRGAEHDDVGRRVRRHQASSCLDARGNRTLCADQNHIDGSAGESGEQLVTVRYAVDATDTWDRGHDPSQSFPHAAAVVANQDRRHGDSFLQPSDVLLPIGRLGANLDTIWW